MSLSHWRCSGTGPAPGAPVVVAVRPAAPLPGIRGGTGCPNLLQRPGSRRSTGRESLIFRASSRGRSQPGAPLQQIRTHPRPEPPQEPHPHHPAPARPRHHDDPGRSGELSGEKGPLRRLGTGGVRDEGRKARAGRLFEPPDCSPAGSPAPTAPFSLRYAFSPSTAREKSAAEGEGAQQTRRGVADDPVRPLADPGATGQEPRGATAPKNSPGNSPGDSPGNPLDPPVFQRERLVAQAAIGELLHVLAQVL